MMISSKNISSSYISRIVLIVIAILSPGFCDFLDAVPPECLKTEWVISDDFYKSDQVHDLSSSDLVEIDHSRYDYHSNLHIDHSTFCQISKLVINIQTGIYQNRKSLIFRTQCPEIDKYSYPSEEANTNTIG